MMAKRTVFTTITALPPGITRESVREALYDHGGMIDLNPLVVEHHSIKPPATTAAEEYHCEWYQLTDKIQYLPNGLYSGRVSYRACFHDMSNGLQTHVYAPLGLDIKGKWTFGGSLPGEPKEVAELGLGVPEEGLWLREDVDMTCNILMTGFVKKNLKNAHGVLIQRLVHKAHRLEAKALNKQLKEQSIASSVATTSPKGSLEIMSDIEFGNAGGVGNICKACGAGRGNSSWNTQLPSRPWSPNSIKRVAYDTSDTLYQDRVQRFTLQISDPANSVSTQHLTYQSPDANNSDSTLNNQSIGSSTAATVFPIHEVSPYWNPQNRISRPMSQFHPLGQNPSAHMHETRNAIELDG